MSAPIAPQRLPIDVVDLDMLAEALADGSPEAEWYFHLSSGDVRPTGDWNDGWDAEELEDQGWVWVQRSGGRGPFEDMEVFTKAIGDVRARDLLSRALEGRGAFRRFRDTIREFPDLVPLWRTWSDGRERARAIAWLVEHDYVVDTEADAALAECHVTTRVALDAARGAGGASIDAAEAPARWTEVLELIGRGEAVTLTRGGVAIAAITAYERQG